MKYESNILERLIKTYGVVGNPKYVSEIIKQFIIQGKECYPNLFTYQSDWLAHIDEFGLTNDYVVTYTGQRFYAPNTKESPVKRAVLKGNTLMNVVSEQSFGGTSILYEYRFYDNIFYEGETFTIFVVNPNVTIINVGLHNPTNGAWIKEDQYNVNNNKRVVYTVPSGDYCCKYVGVLVNTAYDATGFENSLVIMRGDKSNLEIDKYFDGMQSVKMPVLTTSNEDGTKTNILTANEDVTLRSNGSVYDELDLLTGKLTQRIDEDGSVLTQEVIKTVDLNIKDQNNQVVNHLTSFEGGTHFDTSSQTGSVLPTLEVDVVVDLEETLKTCSLEGNTM